MATVTTMTTITTTADAADAPDKQVKYVSGMVLRAVDFEQDQQYALRKLYLHDKSLHGYGIVHGLKVTTAEATTAGEKDVTITIEAGMGVDRWGRVFTLQQKQCASLQAWLKKNGNAPAQPIYIMAAYEGTPDNRVALAGSPCSNGSIEDYSRIADSFKLELTYEKPEKTKMWVWKTSLRLRELMERVRIAAWVKPNEDDSVILIKAIKELGPDALPATLPAIILLSAATAQKTLEAAERTWVMERLPTLYAEDSKGGPFVLLGTLVPPGPAANTKSWSADQSDSPYLLHTQLFQGFPSVPAPISTPKRVINLVTITPQAIENNSTAQQFEMWFHLDVRNDGKQVVFGSRLPTLEIIAESSDGTLPRVAAILLAPPASPNTNLYTESLALKQNTGLTHLRFVFNLNEVTVNIPTANTRKVAEVSLLDYLAEANLAFEGAADSPTGGHSVTVFVRNPAGVAPKRNAKA